MDKIGLIVAVVPSQFQDLKQASAYIVTAKREDKK
jgi:hypothetical protein